MAISTTRPATDDDVKRMEAAARRFCERHGVKIDDENEPELYVEYFLENYLQDDKPALARSWRRSVLAALRNDGDTIAYGYVGWHVN